MMFNAFSCASSSESMHVNSKAKQTILSIPYSIMCPDAQTHYNSIID